MFAVLLVLVPGFWISHFLHLVPDEINPVVQITKQVSVVKVQEPAHGNTSLSSEKVDEILCGAGSPACGTGQRFYDDSVRTGIDDAMALAFFHHESGFGRFGAANTNHSVGNIICTPGWVCYDRFRYYNTWNEGIDDWFALIHGPEYCGSGLCTPESIIPKYAPDVENDTSGYIRAVVIDIERFKER